MTSPLDPSWNIAPRVAELASAFRDLALGAVGRPNIRDVTADVNLFRGDQRKTEFCQTFFQHAGIFDRHYIASIPYILEENCRQGVALVDWLDALSRGESRTTYIQTIESSEATFARSVARMAGRIVCTLSNSATNENYDSFRSNAPSNSRFYKGPFFDLTKQRLSQSSFLQDFSQGFDFILEDTAFQMYGPDRPRQIGFAIQNLRSNGIFVVIEKCFHESSEEYRSREEQKDRNFKRNFFSIDEIERKSGLLAVMARGQIHYHDLIAYLHNVFQCGYLIWNSGNFYGIATSNCEAELQRFVAFLGTPCIPRDFMYEMPQRLF